MASIQVIIPTFNRAAMIRDALDSVAQQTVDDWELLVVDDGSTDDTQAVVADWAKGVRQNVRYHKQANAGCGAARNTGLDLLALDTRFVAFLDSDDLWLPHHLRDCLDALLAAPAADFVFTALRRVRHPDGQVLLESNFHPDGQPKAFFKLRTRRVGGLSVIDDPNAVMATLRDHSFSTLGTMLFRAAAVRELRMPRTSNNEDWAYLFRLLAHGKTPAYLDQVNLVVRDHASNVSARLGADSIAQRIRLYQQRVATMQSLLDLLPRLSPRVRREFLDFVAQLTFWDYGYTVLWRNGQTREALAAFRQGMAHRPWRPAFWKVYLLAHLRAVLGLTPKAVS